MSVDKELLLKPHADTEADVEVSGGSVRVRGLTRGQVFVVQQAKDTATMERKILAYGMVEPELTEVEAGRWQEASPAGEIEPVVDMIRELSGLQEGSEKEAMRQFQHEPGTGVRILSGTEAEHDSGTSTPGDEPS